MRSAPPLKLSHYYWVEALNSLACTCFLFCVFYWARIRFNFSNTENLLLSATQGLIYMFSTRYGGRLSDRMGYDRMIGICILMCAAVLLLGWIPSWRYAPFVVIACYTLAIAPTWPALEAAILHSDGRTSMPDRLGLYNIAWAGANVVALIASAFLVAWKPDSILWVPGLLHLAQWIWLTRGPRATVGAEPPPPHRGDSVPREVKKRFMHTAWLANGLGFLMLAGFASLAPQIGERLGLPASQTILLTCTFFFARASSFALYWKWETWHYHMGWSQLALWLAPFALALAFFSTQIPVVFGALIVFGLAAGLSYSGSIYYSLDYGDEKGELGGLHESILGVGIFIGPLLAACGSALGGGTAQAQASRAEWTILALALVANLVGMALIRKPPPR